MGQRQQSIAKITRPSVSRVLQRKRLFHLLDRERKNPVIWVSAHGGSGKTTLITSYLDSRKLPCLWYQVDECDNDISGFFYYMGIAAKKGAPQKRRPLPLLTPEYLPGLPVFTQRYFEELYSRLRTPSVIVFDNYQDVPADSGFHDVVNKGLSLVPDGVNVIVISRAAPLPKFARLRANNKMHVIEWEEVRFTRQETAEMMRFSGQKKVAEETLDELYEKTDGWAAGLVLLLEKAKKEGITPQLIGKVTQEGMFDYFATEIFEAADNETRDFLMKTAFLPSVTPVLALQLTGQDRARHILARLSEDHFFTTRLERKDAAYQYHALFREFLLCRVRDTFDKEEIGRIKRKAAQLLEESGQVTEAGDLLMRAGAWEELAVVVRHHAPAVFAGGRSDVVMKWLSAMPFSVVERDPDLLFWYGVCISLSRPSESLGHLEKAFGLYQAEGNTLGMGLSWAYAADAAHHTADYRVLDPMIERFDGIVSRIIHQLPPDIQLRIAMSVFNALSYRQPQHAKIGFWEEKAFECFQSNSDINVRLQGGVYLVNYYHWIGNLPKARFIIDSMLGFARDKGATDLLIVSTMNMDALYDYFAGATDTCSKKAAAGLDFAGKSGIHVWDYHIRSIAVSASLYVGDTKAAGEMLDEMSRMLGSARLFDKGYFHFLKAWAALLCNDLPQALEHGLLSLDLVRASAFTFPICFCMLNLAEIHHEIGETRKALEYLAEGREMAVAMRSAFLQYSSLFVEANMTLDCGDYEVALDVIRRAMEIGRKHDFMNVLMWRAAVMAKICAKALEHAIEVEYVQRLILKRNLAPEVPPLELEDWPYPVKIYTSGCFKIVKDGQPISFEGKVQKTPLAMLKALIALGGKDVPEERLLDALWPEAEGDSAHRSFETTLYRLRRLMGSDRALQFGDGRLSLNEGHCWVDVRALEHMMKRADASCRQLPGGEDADRVEAAARKTFGLYRGMFLPGSPEEPWLISFREGVRSRFLGFIGRFGRYLEGAGQWRKAAEWFERGIEIDCLFDEFYQHLIVCYERLGQEARAIEAYRRCESALANAIGIRPSSKTQALYSSIIQKQKIR